MAELIETRENEEQPARNHQKPVLHSEFELRDGSLRLASSGAAVQSQASPSAAFSSRNHATESPSFPICEGNFLGSYSS
jgi:hypothetical protein